MSRIQSSSTSITSRLGGINECNRGVGSWEVNDENDEKVVIWEEIAVTEVVGAVDEEEDELGENKGENGAAAKAEVIVCRGFLAGSAAVTAVIMTEFDFRLFDLCCLVALALRCFLFERWKFRFDFDSSSKLTACLSNWAIKFVSSMLS